MLENNSTLHFLGLFSDGNVHSNINHLKAMVAKAAAEGVKTIRIHALLDGRDVPENSALEYVEPFEEFLAGASVVEDKTIVRDGNVITAKGMGAAFEFGLELVRALKDDATADKISASVFYK